MKHPKITDIILDFDGTCTQIPKLYVGFRESYFEGFAKQMDDLQLPITYQDWLDALELVRSNSPHIGWTVATCPSAPAAGDPYIQTFEAACHILRSKQSTVLPDFKIFEAAYAANTPQWRPEAENVFNTLQGKGVKLHFISNSSTKKIQDRLKDLTLTTPIPVQGGAAKFTIRELTWDPLKQEDEISPEAKKIFQALPASCTTRKLNTLGRPAYLRRGSYFEAIYTALEKDMSRLHTTIFCGDIWELDLAMPHELGANVHLIERVSPFDTYGYERDMVVSYRKRGKISEDLSGLLKWM